MTGPQPALDRAHVRALDRLPRTGFEGRVYRHLAPGYGPLSSEGARIHGGRWNPPDSFPALYTALEPAISLAELARAARLQGLRPSDLVPRILVSYDVRLSRVLDLTDPAVLDGLGLHAEELVADDLRHSRAIGAAARFAGFEALRAESTARRGAVTVPIFVGQLLADSNVMPTGSEALEELRLESEEREELVA